MSRFDGNAPSQIEQEVRTRNTNAKLASVNRVYEHTQADDNNNFVIDVNVFGEGPLGTIPFVAPSKGEINVPEVGDVVVVEWRGGDKEIPIARQSVHTNETRPPVGKAGMWRRDAGAGDVFAESYTVYDGDPSIEDPSNLSVEQSYARFAAKDAAADATESDATSLPAGFEVHHDANSGKSRGNAVNVTVSWDRVTKSSNFSTDGSAYYSVDTSGGGVTVTLSESDEVDGRQVEIRRDGGSTVTVETESSSTIAGQSSVTIDSDGNSIELVYNADTTDWNRQTSGNVLQTSDKIQIGDDQAGIIVHRSSGTTKDGVSVGVSDWVEIYGNEIHTSDT